MRVLVVVSMEPVVITNRFEAVPTTIPIAILHPGQLGLLHDNELVTLVVLNPDSEALVGPLCELGPFVISDAPDPGRPGSHYDRPILRNRNTRRFEELIPPIDVLGRLPVLKRVARRQLHGLLASLILVPHHRLLSPLLFLVHEWTAHQRFFQLSTEGVSPGRPQGKSPFSVGKGSTLHLDIGQALLRDLENLSAFQVGAQDDRQPPIFRKPHPLQELILPNPETENRVTTGRFHAMPMVICIYRGQKLGKIAILP